MTVTIRLEKALTPDERDSFAQQARLHGRTISEHAEIILFGKKPEPEQQPTTEEDR